MSDKPDTPESAERLLSVAEFARRKKVRRQTVSRAIAEGRLKTGTKWVAIIGIPESELENFKVSRAKSKAHRGRKKS